MMSKSLDHVKCVQRSHVEHTNKTWCGRTIGFGEFTFVDPSHAAENGLQHGRLVACPDCVEVIYQALRNGNS